MINKNRLIKLTQKVISFNSENPPGNEWALAKFIERDMRSLGIEVKTYTYAKNRPNIVATLKGSLPRREAQAGAILLTPHFDTVPIGKGWTFDPLGGAISKGKLYGRGASDDKGNLASAMEVMRSLVESKLAPRKDVVMAATVDEETGSHHGIVPLLAKGVLRPRLALVLDSTDYDAIIAQKGLIHGRIQIFGKKAHGAYNWRGESAIEAAARVINHLTTMKFPYKKHPLLAHPTMNIGVISGGDKVNMVCDFCEFAFDSRFLPGTKHQEVLKYIHQAIRRETRKYKIILDDVQQPYEIEARNLFVRLFMKINKEMMTPAKLKGSEGATVISLFKKHRLAAFATGWAAHGTAHTNDEYIFVDDLFRGTQVLERYIREYDRL